jgi:hypothetical protein
VNFQFGYEFSLNPASRVLVDLGSFEVEEISLSEGSSFDAFFDDLVAPAISTSGSGRISMLPTCVKV